ncbi:MAG: helix-turn-helix domain-containing protein [Verrucomicrobiota bacterium]
MHELDPHSVATTDLDIPKVCPASEYFFYLKLPGGEHTCRTGYWVPDSLPSSFTGYKSGFTLQYTLQGEGHYEDETGTHVRFRPGVVLFRQGTLHHTVARGSASPWRTFFLELPLQFFNGLREVGIMDPMLRSCHRPLTSDVVVMLNTFIERARHLTLNNQILFLANIHQLFIDITPENSVPVEEDARLQEKLTLAREMLADPEQRDAAIPEIARRVGLGYHHFRKAFVKSVGISPKEFRIRSVILCAKDMCLRRCWTIAEIAEKLGYPDAATFSKQFKRITGHSPREFCKRSLLTRDES